MQKTLWRARDVAKATSQARHLEALERELKKNPCKGLEDHIIRLKVAWGRACKTPSSKRTAA